MGNKFQSSYSLKRSNNEQQQQQQNTDILVLEFTLSLKLPASSCYLNKKEKPHPSEPVFYVSRSHPFLIFTLNSGSVIKRPELELTRAEARVLLGLQQAGEHRDTHRWGMLWAAPSWGQAGDTAISQGSRELLGSPAVTHRHSKDGRRRLGKAKGRPSPPRPQTHHVPISWAKWQAEVEQGDSGCVSLCSKL